MGHERRITHDGLEALGITEAFHPEVVLLDLGPLGAVGCDDQVGSEVFG